MSIFLTEREVFEIYLIKLPFDKRDRLMLQLSFQFVTSLKVKAYFMEASMNVLGPLRGSFIMKKLYLGEASYLKNGKILDFFQNRGVKNNKNV